MVNEAPVIGDLVTNNDSLSPDGDWCIVLSVDHLAIYGNAWRCDVLNIKSRNIQNIFVSDFTAWKVMEKF